ncbi:MAG: OprO/OprP family phosphate-selective porin [Opitutaceae bacterium]|jgi:phosphate-selective porin|nr:OprO/OprP family phosphate-selective porin [Opitutaceae bacterium]
MVTILTNRLALLGAATLAATTATLASDSGALLDALIRKGVLTDQEAEEIRVDLTRDADASMLSTISGGKSTTGLKITGRVQAQYYALDTDSENPAHNNHFGMRRIYVGASARLGPAWSAEINYDFAGGGSFDKAFIRWEGDFLDQDLALDLGLRKVNVAYEEYTSSGSLKAIERSAATRFFVEDDNGRRLGAASYRIGAFADINPAAAAGKATGFFYGAAITNPERTDSADKTTGNDESDRWNNDMPAIWANAGYSGKFSSGAWTLGAGLGYLPDQGGWTNTAANPRGRGQGDDLALASLYGATTLGRFTLAGEVLAGKVENGAVGGADDASPWGVWIQPSYMLTDKLELVLRYSHVDTDGRGIRASDGIKYAAGSGLRDKMDEYYAGMNYYIVGTDVKLQLGYVGGKTSGAIPGAAGSDETVSGIRSQLQVNF